MAAETEVRPCHDCGRPTVRRRRPPCPIFPDCRVDHLTAAKGARRG